MLRFAQAACLAIACCSMPSGCAHRACCRGGCTGSAPGENAATEAVESPAAVVERGTIEPELSALEGQPGGALGTPPGAPADKDAPSQYRQLDARQCQCLAARHSLLGNLLASESSLAVQAADDRRAAEASARRDVLAYRSIDERNRSAAAALRFFYALAEAEANRDLLALSVQEIDRTIANFEKLKDAGLPIRADEGLLRRQKLTLLDQQAELMLSVGKLNGQLRGLIGVEPADDLPLWPAADLTVATEPVDVQAAVTEGLPRRADLAIIRALQNNLDADAMGAVRGGLQSIDPMLGSSAASRRLFGQARGHSCTETQARRLQLNQLGDQRRAAAESEIRQAAQAVAARLRQVELAKGQRDSRKQQLDRLRQKREADGVSAFDVGAAKLELLKAESELLRRAIAWRVAQVELREAQGLLAAECGYRVVGSR